MSDWREGCRKRPSGQRGRQQINHRPSPGRSTRTASSAAKTPTPVGIDQQRAPIARVGQQTAGQGEQNNRDDTHEAQRSQPKASAPRLRVRPNNSTVNVWPRNNSKMCQLTAVNCIYEPMVDTNKPNHESVIPILQGGQTRRKRRFARWLSHNSVGLRADTLIPKRITSIGNR